MRRDVSRGCVSKTERKLCGPDLWVYGLGDTNRKIIEIAARYTNKHGLTSRLMSVGEMLVPGPMAVSAWRRT